MTVAEWQAIRLTLCVALTAVLLSLPLAVSLAWLLAKRRFYGKFLVETLVNLPLVLPPVVTGYLLLVACGRSSSIWACVLFSIGKARHSPRRSWAFHC